MLGYITFWSSGVNNVICETKIVYSELMNMLCFVSISDEFANAFAQAKEVLKGWKPKETQCWSEREEALHDSWEEIRGKLYQQVIKQCAPPINNTCRQCGMSQATIRCNDPCCGQYKYYCTSCDQEQHKHQVFHDRDMLMDGHFVPISPTVSHNSNGEWINISMVYNNNYI